MKKYKETLEFLFRKYNINSITCNASEVKTGGAFFAIKGKNFDGNDFIKLALDNGASLIITDSNVENSLENIVRFDSAREAFALASKLLYPKEPSFKVAVTGTNGKSSVVSYFVQIMAFLGIDAASIGTLGIDTNNDLHVNFDSSLTTPNSLDFHKNLDFLKSNQIDYLAFEASSHALSQARISAVSVKAAAFTSFSQDHLDYHENMEEYLAAKLRLFQENLEPDGTAIINDDIIEASEIYKSIPSNINIIKVGFKADSGLRIQEIDSNINYQKIKFSYKDKEYEFTTEILGSFQAYNILIAALLVANFDINFEKIVSYLGKLKSVEGRLERIENNCGKHVFVDYAHTPDALEKSLTELKGFLGKDEKLWVVFGCGGNRDNLKRPIMGKIASEIADKVVVTDDNPRHEDPSKIRQEILHSTESGIEIADRFKAIEFAILNMNKGDILLIAGKGHENYQIIGDSRNYFSDKESVLEIFKRTNVIPKSFKNENGIIWDSKSLSEALGIEVGSDLKTGPVEFNSQKISGGEIFFALPGNRDGHDFVKDALDKGAKAAVVSKIPEGIPHTKLILVKDTTEALKKLALYKRRNSKARFICLTGSVGKTSTKNAIYALLSGVGKSFCSRENFNNYLGVLINLASMPDDTEYSIFELGMNHAGEIRELTKIVQPDIALITMIEAVHIEYLGSLEAIADAKSEIFEGLEANGIAVINSDAKLHERLLDNLNRLNIKNIYQFGKYNKADVMVKSCKNLADYMEIILNVFGQEFELKAGIKGGHQALNIAAATLIAKLLKVNLKKAITGVQKLKNEKGRGNIIEVNLGSKKVTVINDSYNASAASIVAGLAACVDIPRKRMVVVLADIYELGEQGVEVHKQLAPSIISQKKIDYLITIGPLMKHLYDSLKTQYSSTAPIIKHFNNVKEIYDFMENFLEDGDLVFFKGSRGTKLFDYVEHLTGKYADVI